MHERAGVAGSWGIDAGLTTQVDAKELTEYVHLLKNSGVNWLREREPKPQMAALKAAGFHVVAFLGDLHTGKPRVGDTLPEDLSVVFERARQLAKSAEARNVDAWEMVGEPDVGYCIDLPDRVVAFQKAVYLGIKAGSAEAQMMSDARRVPTTPASGFRSSTSVPRVPLVLMGALALPPGPWLERAINNGLLDYTDAYNFHFYGKAGDLAGVIRAHDRIASTRQLPLWITECGINAVSPVDFLNSERRQLQAEFTLSTARQALTAKNVAVFMPFILKHENDPHAITLTGTKVLPGWDAYAEFTRQNPWPRRRLAQSPHALNPIVVQWLPDVGAAVAHKVSGTYRFWMRQPVHGEIRIYNFSEQDVNGMLRATVPAIFRDSKLSRILHASDVRIPARGCSVIPVAFFAPASGYARGDCDFAFTDSSGKVSKACFGLETWPEGNDFTESELPIKALPARRIQFPEFSDYEMGENCGPWQTINGLHVATTNGERGSRFWIEHSLVDPLRPAMAFAAINGVPGDGFLRMQLDQPMGAGRMVRIDLVDADGQRFCIWENLGQSYFVKSTEVWLNVRDMQVFFWGHCSEIPTFHPERVREIQLWFYRMAPGEKMRVELSWMEARKPALSR